jgi:LysM repeat protein
VTSKELADLLIKQATGTNLIRLNDAVLGTSGLDDLVKEYLRRPDGTLFLTVEPEDIPPDPPPSGFTIQAASVPTGADAFLHLDRREAPIEFLVGTTIDLVLTVSLAADWKFSDSFPEVAHLPYDDLSFDAPTLTFATNAPATPPEFLLFAAGLVISGLFEPAAALVGASGSYPLLGALSGSGKDFAFDLSASFQITDKPLVGMLTLDDVGAGVSLTSVKRDDAVDRLVQIYLDATVAVEGVDKKKHELTARAGMPIVQGGVDSAILSLVPGPDGLIASLGDLGSMVAGETWDDFFSGPASVIKDFFNDFGLKGYSLAVSLDPLAPTSMSLAVGTGKDWTFWPEHPEYKLGLNGSWTLVFLGGAKPASYLVVTATFTYKSIGFELSIDSNLLIAGRQLGEPLTLSLAELNRDVFDGGLAVPVNLDVSVGELSFSIDVNGRKFGFGAVASFDFGLFDTRILALRDLRVQVTIDMSKTPTTYTARLDGQVALGPIALQADATITNDPNVHTVFTLHLVGETVGSMLNHIVHLVDPTTDVSFGDPWDRLLAISLDAFVLEVDVTAGTVSLSYTTDLDLVFLKITKLSLSYAKGKPPATASSTKVEIEGTFLGQKFGGDSGKPALGWDPVNQNPPAVPGKGSALFDLQYAGLGQHVAFAGEQPATVEQAIKDLRKWMVPVQPGQVPPFGGGKEGLVFSSDSNWLIGAQFSVMGTVAISAIFNDPKLYGILIQLSGEKARVFAGLSFEILYRKVTDTIGVYHVELKLPDAMRNLQFGAVSLTLPIVVLDVYTNGNFRIDFGFPKGLDFSRSFSIQVFPFIGYGGFYFALLDGSTSSRVPRITNGTFSPVIEFGVALAIGVGKTIEAGILKGGISVTVVGILQGVVGWFRPTEPAPEETYYWVQGTIAVTGKLYATIDFAIVQASVDVTAYLSVTLTIQAHEPIYIAATARVSVRVGVKVVFFTIHLSFEAQINASFTIGQATPTPWKLASGNGASSDAAARVLRGQRTLHAAIPMHAGLRRALRQARVVPDAPLLDWPVVPVLPQGKQKLPLFALPAFTKSESWAIAAQADGGARRAGGVSTITTTSTHDLDQGDVVTIAGVADASFDGTFTVSGVPSAISFTYAQTGQPDTTNGGGTATAGKAAQAADEIVLLTASNSIAPDAVTLADHRVLAGDDPGSAPFNLLMQAMLAWGILAETGHAIPAGGASRSGGTTTIMTATPHGLEPNDGVRVLGVDDASFDGTFTVATVPTPTSFTYAQAGDAATSGHGWAAPTVVTADELEALRKQLDSADTVAAAFGYETLAEFLGANFTFDVAPATDAAATGVAIFPMIPAIRLTDSTGIDVDFTTYKRVDAAYVASVRSYFKTLQVQFESADGGRGGDAALGAVDDGTSMATIVFSQYFDMLMSAGVKAAIDFLAAYPTVTGTAPMSIAEVGAAIGDDKLASEPLRVVSPNQDAEVLVRAAALDLLDVRELPGVVHQVAAGETFATIAAAFSALGAEDGKGVPYSAEALITANAGARGIFVTGTPATLTGATYTTQAQDTLDLVATRLLVRAAGTTFLATLVGLDAEIRALLAKNPAITDPNAPIASGTDIVLPDDTPYTAAPGDTLTLVAAYLLAFAQGSVDTATFVAALLAANPNLPEKDPTKPQPENTVLTIPAITFAMPAGASVETLATTFVTTPDVVEASLLALPATPQLLAQQAVLAVPLRYPVQEGDTFAKIAAKLDLTLDDVAFRAIATSGLFAPGKPLTILDLESIEVQTLLDGLLAQAEWNNASGMVSRFMLSGLRLPDPNDEGLAGLEPLTAAAIRTKPMYALTGQRYPAPPPPPPSGYSLTLANGAGVSWLTFGGQSSTTFQLTSGQAKLLVDVATTPLDPQMEAPTRLALFQMVPPRIALPQHVSWQAAARPSGCLANGAATGNPSIWPFSDALVLELEQAAKQPTPLLYEVVAARHYDPDRSVTAEQLGCYAWATIVPFTVSQPQTDGPAPAIASACVVEGADDVGAGLLQQVYTALAAGATAQLYLLYPPDPATPNPTGLASDKLDPAGTYLLKANLSTLTHSGGQTVEGLAAADPTDVYAADLSHAAEFVALLWEASVTRSGGFYLQYAQAGGGGLPPTLFTAGATAQLSLLVVLDSQAATRDAAILPFNNCAVVGDNVDTTTTSVFVQPATQTVQERDTLTLVTDRFNAAWRTTFGVVDVAGFNADVPLLLAVGQSLAVPGSGTPYEIAYGDTLAGIVAKLNERGLQVTLKTLVEAGTNATSPILAAGATMQFATGVLRPATTVPPGTAGFEITRKNPDPNNLPWPDLQPWQVVGSLFNLAGWSIAEAGAFTASGEGLPTTPADDPQTKSDGLTLLAADDTSNLSWYYRQALAVSPFGTPQQGSASPALPPAAANPYNGVGYDAETGHVNRATIDLRLQDVYGNAQQLATGLDEVDVPVGYYDDLVGVGSWPSLATSYLVSGPPPRVDLAMAFQQTSYVPSPAVPVDAALAAIKGDLRTYRTIYYQLVQPDVRFSLQTSLVLEADGETPVTYPLSELPFLAFARGAYVYLAALATQVAVEPTIAGTTTSVLTVTEDYGVTAPQLFTANENRRYADVFGTTKLEVPLVYSTVEGDSLDLIVADPEWQRKHVTPTVDDLATFNKDVPLGPGADLVVPRRQVPVAANGSFARTAADAKASAAALAAENETKTGILVAGKVLALGTSTYAVQGTDRLVDVAAKLGGTPAQVAVANQDAEGVLVSTAQLDVADELVAEDDTLATIAAARTGGDVKALANLNAGLPNLFAPATQIQVAWNPDPVAPTAAETLAGFAAANGVTIAQLASANVTAEAVFTAGAKLVVPGALQPTEAPAFGTYTARATDTVGRIAKRFGVTAAYLVKLNPDIPGLLAANQPVKDTASGKSVTTEPDDSFTSIVDRFASIGVTVDLDQLAGDVAAQSGLVLDKGLWISPPLRPDAGGENPALTLRGLTDAYGADLTTLATANAATVGVLAPGIALPVGGITTGYHETLNSLVNRLAEKHVAMTVAEVAAAVAGVANLVAANATIMPLPPPSPPGNGTEVTPRVARPVFQVSTSVVVSRNQAWIDPDFGDVPAVATSASAIAPEPDPQGAGNDSPYTLTAFARALQTAIPGLAVAVGDPAAEGDPASASTIWAVNFGSACGPQIGYRFQPSGTRYFALPPLSRSLMGGQVDVPTYVSGQDPPFGGDAQKQTFQAVDLDVWLGAFLSAVDLVLSPAYAVPAYAAAVQEVVRVIECKKALAGALADRVQNVFDPAEGSLTDAQSALYQALLAELSTAFTVSTLVQVPVDVTSPIDDPLAAPRLEGKVVMGEPSPDRAAAGDGPPAIPSAFSFSTAKVSLTEPAATTTFLFSVKSPAEQRQADLDLQYVVSELELPDPTTVIGGYEGSSWLKFVLPLDESWSALPGLQIPIPLRAYPSPVTLVLQEAKQSFESPQSAPELLPWNLSFVYQHDDAAQDTPLAEVTFNLDDGNAALVPPQDDPRLPKIFAALAKFTAIWPALKNDLATLPLTSPGMPTPTATAAVKAFAVLVRGVTDAFTLPSPAGSFEPPPEQYAYQFQKEQSSGASPMLTKLVVTFVDPADGRPRVNAKKLWPTVYATYAGAEQKLQLDSQTQTQSTYLYPPGIPAGTALAQRFAFPWPNTKVAEPGPPKLDVTLAAPQTFQFYGVNVLAEQSARAGVSIWRNLSLVEGLVTNSKFVYQTPITAFTSSAVPSIAGLDRIPIGTAEQGVADALGAFLEQLLKENVWAETDTLAVRLAVGYSYAVTETTNGDELDVLVPIFLIPSYDLDPSTDWKVAPGSFVCQIESALRGWRKDTSATNASYVFDFTIYASKGNLQPLIHASTLRYALPPSGAPPSSGCS